MGFRLWCVLLGLFGVFTACTALPQRHEFVRVCMGVKTRVIVYAADAPAAEELAGAAFAEISRLDAVMSDYRVDSELSRLNAGAGAGPMPVSRDMDAILRTAAEISRATDGAFDVTAGPVVALWRASRRTGTLPEPGQLAAARALVAWRDVLHGPPGAVEIRRAGMKLDLGAIAKGYAADAAVRTLRQAGASRCLVALAGDIAVGEPPPGERGWRIEVRSEGDGGPPAAVLVLRNTSVSTSGGDGQFVTIGGRRYAHVIDVRTGLGSQREGLACVVAENGGAADALSTAAFVMNADDVRTALPPGARCLLVRDGRRVWLTGMARRHDVHHGPKVRLVHVPVAVEIRVATGTPRISGDQGDHARQRPPGRRCHRR